ncbi:hypothetical protein K432DRAFT_342062 [Lepidopterella palustris CBS 459.81]|uniref:gamma-glutamylcyclotransferase n=1 Tax=Lepidopterella palustris CBS 459.81 TaxID=1314670 RepID=A0A8E2EL46_9PEZI|nr:hypothetical protein K432DRAFT_342062 [Lepidopterella palustris CBS 459.81]
MAAPQTTIQPSSQTLYFGYGSNLWLHQMHLRCPTSKYLGVARLPEYRWIINQRGYANVVSCPANEMDEVYGLVFSLLPADEDRLDVNEGVPHAYTKEILTVNFWPGEPSVKDGWVDVRGKAQKRDVLVYVDRKRVDEYRPQKEYVYRMNMGIGDALRMGVPTEYVDRVMRPYIPEEKGRGKGEENELEEVAMRQAKNFIDMN